MTKRPKKPGIVDEKEFEKLSLAEKFKYLSDKREEIDRRVRRLINPEEKE